MIVFHTAKPDSIAGIPSDLLALSRLNLESRARSKS